MNRIYFNFGDGGFPLIVAVMMINKKLFFTIYDNKQILIHHFFDKLRHISQTFLFCHRIVVTNIFTKRIQC